MPRPTTAARPRDSGPASEVTRVHRVAGAPAEATRVEVDLAAIVANLHAVKAHVGGPTGVLAVLKGDAYGHGTLRVALALDGEAPLSGFVVTSVNDGLRLRQEGIARPIVVMATTFDGAVGRLLGAELTPVIGSVAELATFARVTSQRRARTSVHVEIDTGMSRLGVREDALDDLLEVARAAPQIVIHGLCTHLASAESDSDVATRRQLDAFDRAIARVRAAGHAPSVLHASNTAATYRHPRSHFTHVRVGVALFGGDAPSGARLRPALRLVTRIAQLRSLRPGDAVSYGEQWRATRPSVVATLPVGYGHGYPRRLAGRAEVLIGGRRCPVVGAICMEMMVVDVTELGPRVAVGDDAVLLGAQDREEVTAVELAERADGIVEELFCGLGTSLPRDYEARS